ncbi:MULTISPECIES: hypothetical protein [unclassified Nocardioides]|uniref:hypothetical protein n=1 Tax=unclassified Nocardioides TaxID=2615069 RepID=UPI0030144B0A
MQQRPQDRPSPFPLIVSIVLTAYLAVVTFFLGRDATTEADAAVQHLLWVLCGGAALVVFCLFVQVLDGRAPSSADPRRETEDA